MNTTNIFNKDNISDLDSHMDQILASGTVDDEDPEQTKFHVSIYQNEITDINKYLQEFDLNQAS